jgi:HlyD family secretion protein
MVGVMNAHWWPGGFFALEKLDPIDRALLQRSRDNSAAGFPAARWNFARRSAALVLRSPGRERPSSKERFDRIDDWVTATPGATMSPSVTTESLAERLGIGQPGVSGARLGRRWVGLIAAMIGVGVAVWVWSRSGESAATDYMTHNLTRGDLIATVIATGTLAPINQVEVGSELSGIIKAVAVDDNDRVRVGQILARLDATKIEAQASQIKAALAAARAKVQQTQATEEEARAQLARAEQLASRQLISQSDLDTARATLKRGEADRINAAAAVTQAEATLQATQTDLTKTIIRSPINGVVLERRIEPGQTVAASFQAPVLFTLAEDLTKMELDVDVDEADVGQVQAGQDATFTVDAYPDRVFTARVATVRFSSTTTSGVVTYKTVLYVDNSGLLLRPGMTTTADIIVRRVSNAIVVPNAALRFAPATPSRESSPSGGGLLGRLMPRPPRPSANASQSATADKTHQRLWILRDGQPMAIEIRVGMTDGKMTELVSGDIQPGTPVIVQSAAANK